MALPKIILGNNDDAVEIFRAVMLMIGKSFGQNFCARTRHPQINQHIDKAGFAAYHLRNHAVCRIKFL